VMLSLNLPLHLAQGGAGRRKRSVTTVLLFPSQFSTLSKLSDELDSKTQSADVVSPGIKNHMSDTLEVGYKTAKEVLAEKSTTEQGGNETLNEEAEVESDVMSNSDTAKSAIAFSPRRCRKGKENAGH
jgi:hypothetical protein